MLDRANVELPGSKAERGNRLEAVAAVSGIATGAAVGAATGWLRRHGWRLGRFGEAVFIGGAAMALTDGSMAALGVSDPREWSAADWAADALPHLVYGAATAAVLNATDQSEQPEVPVRRTRIRTVIQAALIGAATGGRATAGVTALAMTSHRRGRGGLGTPRRLAAFGTVPLAVGELAVDKRPETPNRLEPSGLVPRAVFGLTTGASIGRRRGENIGLPALAGLGAAIGGSMLGSWWRTVGAERFGIGALPAALIEDVVVTAVAIGGVAGT